MVPNPNAQAVRKTLRNVRVPSGVDDLDGVVAQVDDGDFHQYQVVSEKPLFLLLLLLHEEVNFELLEASSSRVDQRDGSDLWNEFTQVVTCGQFCGVRGRFDFVVAFLSHLTCEKVFFGFIFFFFLKAFVTWTAVFDRDEGREVLGVVAEHYGVFVAFCGRPVEGQINPTNIQRGDGGARFHTPDNLICWEGNNRRMVTSPFPN